MRAPSGYIRAVRVQPHPLPAGRVQLPHLRSPLDPVELRARQLLGLLPPPELIALLFFAVACTLMLVTRG
jgi:hypothetical protein